MARKTKKSGYKKRGKTSNSRSNKRTYAKRTTKKRAKRTSKRGVKELRIVIEQAPESPSVLDALNTKETKPKKAKF